MSAFFTHREIPYEEVAAFALDGVFFLGENNMGICGFRFGA
jgi:hypothetical protein